MENQVGQESFVLRQGARQLIGIACHFTSFQKRMFDLTYAASGFYLYNSRGKTSSNLLLIQYFVKNIFLRAAILWNMN